ncbi:hypothetical protein OPT61_g5022 [Boeremia exigua]|uniref:Uncharacterized protein n=1 Tax=Boeremia exigua TaxID=749465 RepID=A0ACC2IBS1_9PLEO|nr:hypothetical protein OPT61_g5022 [Boeremia exigua]
MDTISITLPVQPQSKLDKFPVVSIVEIELSEDGNERTFHNTDAAYVLPNDNVEHQRLELQHGLLWRIMGNKVFHAPLSKDSMHKTLDIGCGTGAVTHEMASAFPNAQVLGADLSPVPHVRQKLPNIKYVQGNIMDIDDTRFEHNSFDLIFSRLLVLGMSNWKAYIARCVALTKPGGWVEMHDFSQAVRRVPAHVSSLEHLRPHSITIPEIANSSHPADAYHDPSPWLWEVTFEKLLALKGVDTHCGSKIPSLFAEAGLTDIRIRRYMVPYSRWEGLTKEEKDMADYLETFIRDLVPVAIRKAGQNAGPEYAQEAEEAIADTKRYHEAYEGGRDFLWMYVVCGRKAE